MGEIVRRKELPRQLAAGEAYRWRVDSDDYPPSEGWGLTVYFRANAAGASFEVEAETATDGDFYDVTIASVDTDDKPAGSYFWQAIVDDGTNSLRIGDGTLVLTANLSAETAPYDGRTPARRILDAIDATIEGRATTDQQSYSIQTAGGSRQLNRITLEELTKARAVYSSIVQREQIEAAARRGQSPFQKIDTEFRRP